MFEKLRKMFGGSGEENGARSISGQTQGVPAMQAYMIDGSKSDREKLQFVVGIVNTAIRKLKREGNVRPIMLGLSGYDSDPRPLYHIPEVRQFCNEVFKNVPTVFVFLDPETVNWFFACLADFETERVFQENLDPARSAFVDRLPDDKKAQFMTERVKLAPSAVSILREVFRHGNQLLEQSVPSRDECDRLCDEFTARVNQGIGTPGGH